MEREPYAGLAEIYDLLMSAVDYEAWADYVEALMEHFDCRPRRLVDLACGTGGSAFPFAARGYCVDAVDLSAAMLKKARAGAGRRGLRIKFYRQDLRALRLPRSYDAALLFQDGLNYLLSDEELAAAIAAVQGALVPGGFFVFDLTRPGLRAGGGKGGASWADGADFTLLWESGYDAETALWEIELLAFRRLKNGLYRKFRESHREKDYPPELVEKLLRQAGFSLRGVFPTFTFEPASGGEPKLTFAAQK